MDLKQLEAFKKVVETGSFTKAAATLFVTQPAISHHIQRLEAEIGQALFERSRPQLKLTYTGEVFYIYTRRILNLVEESKAAVRDISAGEQGRITMAAIGTSAIYMLPDFLYRFRQRHPRVQVVLLTVGGEEIHTMVLEDQVDLGIVGSHINTSDLETIPLFEDQIRPLVHAHHPAAHSRRALLADLAREPFIQFGSWKGWKNYVGSIFGQIDAVPQEQFQVDSIDAVKRLVERGLGFTIAPIAAAQDEINAGTLVPLELDDIPPVSRQIVLVYRRDKYMTRSIQMFIDELIAAYDKNAQATPFPEV
ncbi:MAG: LysR family transcriptional regulator [candidate division Zixibacteria bacterium]|nr:LysR family transcriptional regulator [candidate division Zixibacteria bacterium]